MGQKSTSEIIAEERCQRRARVYSDGSLVMGEETSGPVTEATYDTPCHAKAVRVSYPELEKLAASMGSDAGLLAERMGREWSEGEDYLVDLMDRLDAAGVAYSYSACSGDGLSYRPEDAGE